MHYIHIKPKWRMNESNEECKYRLNFNKKYGFYECWWNIKKTYLHFFKSKIWHIQPLELSSNKISALCFYFTNNLLAVSKSQNLITVLVFGFINFVVKNCFLLSISVISFLTFTCESHLAVLRVHSISQAAFTEDGNPPGALERRTPMEPRLKPLSIYVTRTCKALIGSTRGRDDNGINA